MKKEELNRKERSEMGDEVKHTKDGRGVGAGPKEKLENAKRTKADDGTPSQVGMMVKARRTKLDDDTPSPAGMMVKARRTQTDDADNKPRGSDRDNAAKLSPRRRED